MRLAKLAIQRRNQTDIKVMELGQKYSPNEYNELLMIEIG